LKLGETLHTLRPRISGVAQLEQVTWRSWDMTSKKAVTSNGTPTPAVGTQTSPRSKASSALGGGTLTVVDRPAQSSGQAKDMATGLASRMANEVIEATAVALGNPQIAPGAFVTLDGVGKRFGGTHRVVAATHIYRGASGYETRFTLGAGGRPLPRELGGRSGHEGFASHLAIGLVSQNSDPLQIGRVKLKYPALDDSLESDWVRIAWPAAGSSRGIVALPAVNDEVIVGFEHGDVQRPIVLGVLFNGQDKPGTDLIAQESSHVVRMPRTFDAKYDQQIKFVSGQAMTITSGATLDMKSTGAMTIESQAAADIKATAPMTIEGQATVTVKANGEVTIQGNGPVSVTSNAALTLKGSMVTVQSSGVLALQGSEVMIG
ncbi:MAG TPA: phage baseplate assembly protein V, partial [Solirubrobacteraceae bacterium]|nr:phage baseplate assembly protein V [Solirubrobacteraceae bacterium]